MRKTYPTLGAAALSALALLACSPAQAEPPKAPRAPAAAPAAGPAPAGADFRYAKALPAGQTVSIRNLVGTIRAEPSSSSTLEVVATKVSEGGDPALVRVVASEHAGGVTVCALYPGGGDSCEGGGRGEGRGTKAHGESREVKVRVDFVVRVPAGLTFEAANVSGDIEARGLRGDVRATAVSGDVAVSTASGAVEAKSVSGAVRVAMGAPREGVASSASAVSGSVEVRLPAQSNFDAEASTVSGRIETDFGLPVQRGFVGQSLRGRVGRGGAQLRLDTVSGGIRISRS
ncbi:MAG TPA: DUF4097 family beta strand repeat-containing protein [Polyangiaceae bacterium]|nr:DUF4097 family beta strand repeat-containing protein [Polyangiaceae bacterium]